MLGDVEADDEGDVVLVSEAIELLRDRDRGRLTVGIILLKAFLMALEMLGLRESLEGGAVEGAVADMGVDVGV
jgi:hypothetical protein